MKKVIFIIASNNFRDEELLIPKQILSDAGVKISIASSSLNEAKGIFGAIVKPDMTIDKLNPENFDAVIFIGGGGAREYFQNPIAHKIAVNTLQNGKILGAICIAPAILANAGVLKNVKATIFESEIRTLKKSNAIYIENKVVEDGKIITAHGPDSAQEFGELIKSRLIL